jgi:hypothetical protein
MIRSGIKVNPAVKKLAGFLVCNTFDRETIQTTAETEKKIIGCGS